MSETLKTVEQTPSTSDEVVIEQLDNETPQSRLAAAEAAVAALNINSSGTDLVYAHKGLQDAQAEMRDVVQLEDETLTNEAPNYSGVDDLIKIGKNNDTFHRPDGKFLSRDELKAIYDNHEQIRDGIDTPMDLAAKNDQMTEPEDAVSVEDVMPGNPDHAQPALDGETFDEYEARHEALNESAKIDVLEDVVLSPISSEIDTLEGVVLSPVPGEQASADESSPETPEQESTPESGDDKLDEEKQSIWNKAMDRTKDLYAKVGALYSTNMTLYAVGNFLPTPKQKFEKNESIDQFEARVRRYGTYKIIGAVALIVASATAAKHGLSLLDGGGADTGGVNVAPKVSTGPNYGVPEVLATVTPSSEFTPSAHTVTRGEGWYQTFKEMGITNKTEQANVLEKVKSQLLDSGWGYTMPNGSVGISHTGQLPENVLKLIKNSR